MLREKILIITSEFPPDAGGIGNQAFNLAYHLAENNFEVSVLADISHASRAVVEKDLAQKFRLFPVYRHKITFFTYYQRVQKSMSLAGRSDKIILSGKFSLWLAGLIKLFHAQKKMIAVVHGSELLLQKKWQRKLINKSLLKCDSIVAVSNFTKNLLHSSILQKQNCIVIPNGINADEFSDTVALRDVHTQKKNLQLITVGSVTERKGQQNVIEALPLLIKEYPQLCYHIVGTPVLKQKLDAVIREKNLTAHIIFHGAVERKQLIKLLGDSDIKLMLSNNTASGDVEGFGIGILEANALGIPAIGSKNTGIEDAIKDNVTGILVDPENVTGIASAIEKILNNYTSFSTSARQWALQHKWKIIVNKYIDVIESLG